MSVRVLTPGDSVVRDAEDFQTKGSANGTVILIKHLEQSQFTDPQSSNVTYDLRVGPQYRLLTHVESQALRQGESLDLVGGQTASIQTEEHVQLPRGVFGLIVSRVSLAQRGLANISTKVDPGYTGPLVVTVTNNSRRSVCLKRGDAFCSIVFFSVEANAKLYNKGSKSVDTVAAGSGFVARLLERLEGRGVAVHLVLVLVTAALAIITAVLAFAEIFRH